MSASGNHSPCGPSATGRRVRQRTPVIAVSWSRGAPARKIAANQALAHLLGCLLPCNVREEKIGLRKLTLVLLPGRLFEHDVALMLLQLLDRHLILHLRLETRRPDKAPTAGAWSHATNRGQHTEGEQIVEERADQQRFGAWVEAAERAIDVDLHEGDPPTLRHDQIACKQLKVCRAVDGGTRVGGGAAGCNRGRSQWGTRSSVHASCGRFVGSCRRLEPGCDHWRDGVRKVSNQRADGLVKEASVQWPVVRTGVVRGEW